MSRPTGAPGRAVGRLGRIPVVAGEVRVRPPAEADLPAIADLLGQLGYPATVAQVRARLAALAQSGADHLFVAEVEADARRGRVAGLAAVHVARLPQMDAPRAELTTLVTDARFRRRGVGRVLVRAAEELARRQGCQLFFLRSNKRRVDAHAFYRATGFEETHLTFNKRL